MSAHARRHPGRRRALAPLASGNARFFLVLWAALSATGAGWSLSTPLFTSPDESAHVVHAVAVVRGELTGTTIERPGEYYSIVTGVQVPAYYGGARASAACFAGDVEASAGCSPGFGAGSGATATVTTSVGRYPPLYYALVGAPSLVLDGAAAVTGMRLLSAVVGAAALAGALTTLRSAFGRGSGRGSEAGSGPWLAAGLLATTPMTWFLVGTVNPSGLETALGLLTWCALLPVAVAPRQVDVRARLLWGTVAAAALIMVRPSSPVLAAGIALTLVVLTTRSAWGPAAAAVGRRGWIAPAAVAAGAAALVAAWLLVVRPTDNLGGNPDPSLASPLRAVAGAGTATGKYLQQQVGVFGWLDTPAPLATWLPWTACLGALVLAALAVGRRRRALLVLAVLVLAVPVVTQVPTAARLGLIWQGRYLLPLSVGLPLVATAALVATDLGARLARALAPWVVVATAVAQAAALGWALWRYGWGLSTLPLVQGAGWSPPVGAAPALAVGLVGIGSTALVVLGVVRSGRTVGSAPPQADLDLREPADVVRGHLPDDVADPLAPAR